ncbi:hypothetical protein GN244_ATG14218 [Phytophthora infestans]|uniref:Crinkler effector protein N-terminal domain-containing protein n=1 Tax=Phytophthora infestans TaxID=4787 RepID=A0A833SFR5_PHYIN|nr:hypothetical protein GN244_ATG14218 [Phytophthora infestans]
MTRRPNLPPNVEQELELWCLVVGGGEDPFPVIIKTTDRVQELKNTIGDQWLTSTQISGEAYMQRLFISKKGGQWLPIPDPEVRVLAQSAPNVDMLKMSFGNHLNPMELVLNVLGEFEPDHVHILVAAPKLINLDFAPMIYTDPELNVVDSESYQRYAASYRECAERLKDSDSVNKLIGTIHQVEAAKYRTPFISLLGSRGAGKLKWRLT